MDTGGMPVGTSDSEWGAGEGQSCPRPCVCSPWDPCCTVIWGVVGVTMDVGQTTLGAPASRRFQPMFLCFMGVGVGEWGVGIGEGGLMSPCS